MCLALPGQITAIRSEAAARVATVEIAGVQREVNLALVPEATLGDYLIIHSGIAVRLLSGEEAAAAEELIVEALGQ
jgi:hydrogenase expression/formation protein HypC